MTSPRDPDPSATTGAQSIGRATMILRLVGSRHQRGSSLSEIVAGSGLAKPTVRRMLLALIEAGLVEQDEASRRYFLGPETYLLGTLAADRFGIHRLAQESVARLARETGDAAFVQVRRDWSVVCLQREDGAWPIRSHVLSAGDRHPLGVGAGGIALLAALPEALAAAAEAANAPLIAARYPQLDPDAIRAAVAEARRLGHALNRGMVFPGSWGLGVAVRDAEGRADVCLSLAAVEARMQPERQPALVALLRQEAERLEARMREFAQGRQDRIAASPRRRANDRDRDQKNEERGDAA